MATSSTTTRPITAELLDDIVIETLPPLIEEVGRSNWFVREHDVVNLYVFGYLVPVFIRHGLDLTLIGIESPVLKADPEDPVKAKASKYGSRRDLVIWREPRTTCWKGCELGNRLRSATEHKAYLRQRGTRPLAVIEWKNIHPAMSSPEGVEAGYQDDIAWLKWNAQHGMFDVGYAILLDQRGATANLICQKIDKHGASRLPLPRSSAATAGL